ncbi:MAG: hypothetical protein ACPGWR_24270 [Ardenticatenaceae bacterium]
MFQVLCTPARRATGFDGLRWLLVFVCLLLSGCAPPLPDHEVRHLTAIGETVYLQTQQTQYNEKEILRSKDGGRIWQEIGKVPVAVTDYFASPTQLPIVKCLPNPPATCYRLTRERQIEQSTDEGQSWRLISGSAQEIEEVPAAVRDYFASSPKLPIIHCVPSLPATCYRITGQAQIEQSTDEGESWRVIWASPVVRHHFMERFHKTLKSGNCSKSPPNVIPLDIAIADFDQGEHTVVAAMGNEGVLVVSPTGESSRHQIRCANPTPYLVRWDQALKSIWLETLAFAFALLIANPLYLEALRANGRGLFIKSIKLIGALYLLYLAFVLVSAIIGLSQGQNPNDFLIMTVLPLGGVIFLLSSGVPDYMMHPMFWEQAMFASFLLSALLLRLYWRTKSTRPGYLLDLTAFLLVNLCFLLWITGIISHYGTALLLSLLLAGSTWLFAIWSANREMAS